MANCDNCVGCADDAEIHRLCDDCMQEQICEDEERHAAKDAEIAQLRADLRASHAAQVLIDLAGDDAFRDAWKANAEAVNEVVRLRADLARVTADLDEAIEDQRQARDDAARAAALLAVRTMERDACAPLASLPTEFVAGEWIMSGSAEPDAVVTYARVPSPETGHVGWCWWARGKMGDARDYVAAREAAEKALRAHAAGSGKGGS